MAVFQEIFPSARKLFPKVCFDIACHQIYTTTPATPKGAVYVMSWGY